MRGSRAKQTSRRAMNKTNVKKAALENVSSHSVNENNSGVEGAVAAPREEMDPLEIAVIQKKPLANIPISVIDTSCNIRSFKTDDPEFFSLVKSIEEKGLIQSPTVTPINHPVFKFKCLAGHRRLAAALEAGKEIVICSIRYELDEKEEFELSLEENIVRENLTTIDLINNIAKARDQFSISNEKLSIMFGRKDRKFAERLYKASKWPERALKLVKSGKVSTTKVQEIAKRSLNDEEIIKCIERICGIDSSIYSRKGSVHKRKSLTEYFQLKNLNEIQIHAIQNFIKDFNLKINNH